MKIHSIDIQNIASLKGNHSIDFDHLFNESSLFAITGKTGAGKSTILNCISLALYGKVYKKETDGLDFVTLGEPAGKISLSFSNMGHKYQADWSLKLRKKNGELYKKPQLQRNLAIIEAGEKPEYIETEAADVLGLTFDQFCKTTILNQGQFAKFLTSSFKDRKDILEKFYQGISLETLNIKLNEKIRLKKSELDEAQNKIQGHTQAFDHIEVTQAEVSALKEKRDLAHSKKTILELSSDIFKDIRGSFQTIKENTRRLNTLSLQQEEEQKSYNLLKKQVDTSNIELTDTEKKLSNEKPLLIEGIKLFNEYNNLKERSLYLEKQQDKALGRQKDFQSSVEQLESNSKAIEKKLNILLDQFEILSQSSNKDLKDSIQDVISLTQDYEKQVEILDYTKEQQSKLTKDRTDIQSIHEDSKKELQELDCKNIEQSLHIKKQEIQALSIFKEIHTRFQSQVRDLENDIKNISLKEENKLQKIEELEQKRTEVENELDVTDKALKYLSLSKSIHECLEESIKDGKCVVCEQQLPENTHKTNSNQNDETKELLKRLEKQQGSKSQLIEELNQLKLEKLALTSKKESLSSELKQIKADAINEENKVHSMGLRLKSDAKDIIVTIEKHKKSLEELENKSLRASTLTIKINNYESELEKQKQSFSDLKKREIDQQGAKEEIESKIKKIYQKYNLPKKKSELKILQQKIDELDGLVEEKRYTQLDLKNTNSNLTQTTQELDSNAKDQETLVSSIDKIKIFFQKNFNGMVNPNIRLEKLEKSLQLLREEAMLVNKELSKKDVKLAENRSRMSSYKEQINESKIMVESMKEKLAIKLKDINNEDSAQGEVPLKRFLENLSDLNTESIEISDILEATSEYLRQTVDHTKSDYKDLETLYTEKNNDFNRKKENERKVATLNKLLTSHKDELHKLTDLYELIGKDEFRNYILSLIESTLIEQTNKELETLYQGRYKIIQTHKKNRAISEFKIKDYFRDGMSRKVSTLSGGETFLVSLAMAMALAELTRGNTQIDSLFIDEGFGTLDQDSIEEVFELLEKIQHSGKQIGIISHVQSLTNRIALNIQLEKSSSGVSNIDIVYN